MDIVMNDQFEVGDLIVDTNGVGCFALIINIHKLRDKCDLLILNHQTKGWIGSVSYFCNFSDLKKVS